MDELELMKGITKELERTMYEEVRKTIKPGTTEARVVALFQEQWDQFLPDFTDEQKHQAAVAVGCVMLKVSQGGESLATSPGQKEVVSQAGNYATVFGLLASMYA